MTYAAVAAPATFNIGRVIGRGFSILGGNFWKLAGLTLLGMAISVLMTLVGAGVAAAAGGKEAPVIGGLFSLANLIVGVLQFAFIWGAITFAGVADVEGRKASFGECLANGLAKMLPITGLFLLSIIGLFAAYICFFVPCIIVSLMWSVTAQALAVERIGVFEAFSRSVALTRNHRVSIFGLNILVGIGNIVFLGVAATAFAGLIGSLGGALKTTSTPASEIAPLIGIFLVGVPLYLGTLTVATIANACLQTSIYAELRQIKEGGLNTAAVFD